MMTNKIQSVSRLVLALVIVSALLVAVCAPVPAAAQTITAFEQRDNPLYLIASYYNAITLRDYARAYSYWNGNAPGGATLQQFAQGFADLQTVRALARLPIASGVAAGTAHAEVPVVLLTTLTNGGEQIFAGCIHAVHYNVPVGNATEPDPNWFLSSATFEQTESVDFVAAVNACSLSDIESFPTQYGVDNRYSSPDLIASYYDAIAAQDYVRAYNYWQGGAPGQTLSQFAQGFASTTDVGVVVALSFQIGVAAGSIYADAPLLITATDQGQPQLFVGCMVTRKSNVPVGTATEPDPNWTLHSADIAQVGTLDAGLDQVWTVCAQY